MNIQIELTEAEEARRGALLAEILQLKRQRKAPHPWNTTWGTKTDLGLFRTIARIVQDGE